MRLDQSSVDIAGLVDKVERGEIELQPNFQRGQVWPDSKKRRLIDTILRNWYVPAIHIIVNDGLDREEILDGQQRVRSIISFMRGEFAVDGYLEPLDENIVSLHGMKYADLPLSTQSKFKRFTINTVRLRDYTQAEPGELFFRLNQLTALTAAEQRNALIGAPRNQIRELATRFAEATNEKIGFSNSRMNYDDTLARLAVTLELGKLSSKISSAFLERRYRSQEPFSMDVYQSIDEALASIAEAIMFSSFNIRLNKASLFSWLYFINEQGVYRLNDRRAVFLNFFEVFEAARDSSNHRVSLSPQQHEQYEFLARGPVGRECIAIFNDRASSRVNDVTSVLLRDLTLNVCAAAIAPRALSATGWTEEGVLRRFADRLAMMPTDVADRSVAESSLAKQWDQARAHG